VAAEIARTAAEFRACAAGLAGSRPAPRVAVVDRWLDRTFARRFPLQRLHGEDDGTAHALAHHRALRRRGEDVAVRDRLGDLGGLRLIVAPRWTHLDDGDAAALREWVLAGGHLLLGARSGSKDRHGAFHDHRQPGPVLAPLLGAEVEDLHVLTAGIPVAGAVAGCGLRVGERLLVTAADAEVAARWGDGHGWLAGTPALVTRRAGRGRISYLGAQPDDTLADAVAVWALAGAGITTPAADAAVEWCRRIAADGRTITIAVNTGAAPAPAADPAGARALVDDRRAGVLPAWGVAVWAAVG
jgi:beta-galactosidase